MLEWKDADKEKPRLLDMVCVADEMGGWTNGKWSGEVWQSWDGVEFRQPVKWWANLRTPSKFYEWPYALSG
jgi:hypothetical protein